MRHTWNFNVNDSLLVDANCNLSNPTKRELGIDVNVKNLNQVHHPLMTEIVINELYLYCSAYELQQNRVVCMYQEVSLPLTAHNDNVIDIVCFLLDIKTPGHTKLQSGGGLKTNETVSLRCNLQRRTADVAYDGNFQGYVSQKLSTVTVRASEPAAKATLPALEAAGSFLLKNETKFIRVYEPGSNEEFNQIVNQRDSHMTLCVNWSATINDNGASRKAYGQHFVQLRNLYDT